MRKIILSFLVMVLGLVLYVSFHLTAIYALNKIPDLSSLNWLVLGPLPNPQDNFGCRGFQHDYLGELGGETKAQPVQNQKTAGIKWTAYPMVGGNLDFGQIFGPQENKIVYAYCQFHSAASQNLALKIGSDDGVKVWLNGQLKFSHHVHRALTPDEDSIRIHLNSGLNRLLFKIDQGNGGWAFTARLRSINAEMADWLHIKTKHYQICPDTQFLSSRNNQLSLTVLTKPSLAINEEVPLIVSDLQGNLLFQQNVKVGERTTLTLPGKYSGVFQVEISSKFNKEVMAEKILFMAGAPEQLLKETVNRARRTARLPLKHNQGEDFSATLTFLADQLEGKVHSSLVTPERNLRAIRTIQEICQKAEAAFRENRPWPGASLRGVRQWAYRSAIDDSCQPYSLYLPDDYQPSKKYHLAVCLHGYSGDDYGAVTQVLKDVRPADFIVVAPFGRGDMAYASVGEQDVLDVIDLIQRYYSIDPDRIYLTGWSMGGCGTWRIGQFYADRFAAIAPFCGWTSTQYLENLQNIPTRVIHGTDDPTVPVISDQMAVNRLTKLKAPVIYEELPGVNHDAWGGWIKTHGGNQLFDYFRKYRRNQWPQKVEISIPYLRFRKQYWVQVDEFVDPRNPGFMKAQIADARHLEVETDNIAAFTLDLGHPNLAAGGRILLNVNGFAVPVDAGLRRATLVSADNTGRFIYRSVNSGAVIKNDGGGIADIFYRSLYIVYGTANPWRRKSLRQAAEILADWRINNNIFTGTKLGHFQVRPDSSLSLNEANHHNLLLLGAPSENKITARLMAEKAAWPVVITKDQVKVGHKNYPNRGLIMVYPNPGQRNRLVGIIALPYSNDELIDYVSKLRMGLTAYAPDNGTGSFTTPDLLIYNAPGQLIHTGYFDRHWRLKP